MLELLINAFARSFAFTAIEWAHEISIEGKENIPQGPCLVLSKHQLLRDIPFEEYAMWHGRNETGKYVERQSLPLQCILVPMGGIPVYRLQDMKKMDKDERKKADEFNTKSYDRLGNALQEGHWAVVHIEGTRNLGYMGEVDAKILALFKLMEKKRNIEIAYLPMGIQYHGKYISKGKEKVGRGKVDVKIGEALYSKNFRGKDLTVKAVDEIAKLSGLEGKAKLVKNDLDKLAVQYEQ